MVIPICTFLAGNDLERQRHQTSKFPPHRSKANSSASQEGFNLSFCPAYTSPHDGRLAWNVIRAYSNLYRVFTRRLLPQDIPSRRKCSRTQGNNLPLR